MSNSNSTEFAAYLEKALHNIKAHEDYIEANKSTDTVHVPDVANFVVFAYEQLRSVSENIEDHLLLQAAIRRYYKRLPIATLSASDSHGTELIIELTQAQYLKNDSVSQKTVDEIDELFKQWIEYNREIQQEKSTELREKYTKWVLDILSVKTEQLLHSTIKDLTFVHVAHTYFSSHIDYERLIDTRDNIDKNDYSSLLYIAVHKALLKSNDANARCGLLEIYSANLSSRDDFIQFHSKYDSLAMSRSATRITRFVSNNSAPLRILRDMYFSDSEPATFNPQQRQQIESGIAHQIDDTTEVVKKIRNAAVIKSIIFLLITKALIGLLIEIPYDIIVTGSIILVPLLINLLFPPIFLAITAFTFKAPGEKNKAALEKHITAMLFNDTASSTRLRYSDPIGSSVAFNVIYGIVFVAAIYLIYSRLIALDFNILQTVLFFIFFSTAAFLGYRITLHIKEIEHIQTSQGLVAVIRDILYSPFIFIGKRISYRFGRLNIIARVLDVAVDLPLKTFLRLLRQWVRFVGSKKDELI
jgi:hypothetical protein